MISFSQIEGKERQINWNSQGNETQNKFFFLEKIYHEKNFFPPLNIWIFLNTKPNSRQKKYRDDTFFFFISKRNTANGTYFIQQVVFSSMFHEQITIFSSCVCFNTKKLSASCLPSSSTHCFPFKRVCVSECMFRRFK